MNSANDPATLKKRRSTSFPLIFGALLAGFAAYYLDAGPKLMTYVMYLQEQSKVKSGIKEADKNVLRAPRPAASEPTDADNAVDENGDPVRPKK